jgi:ribonuclease BN (tRNA processing enzyme)
LDHICGLEELFYRAYFQEAYRGQIKLFVPAHLVVLLQQRLASYPSILAEGGANFWDAFQLIPTDDNFWQAGFRFSVFPVRHHDYLSAFGLALMGSFLYTGDTRPIPDVLRRFAPGQETIFHDCALTPSPSHTGLSDLFENYDPEVLQRIICYHYDSSEAAQSFQARGLRIAQSRLRYKLLIPPQVSG